MRLILLLKTFMFILTPLLIPGYVFASSPVNPKAQEIMQAVADREEATSSVAEVTFTLTTKGGDRQVRIARRFFTNSDGKRQRVLYFQEPRALRGSAFLSWDYSDAAKEDEQWLYLPTLRRVKRIAGGDRGRAFLGTDLSYDDIKNAGKLPLSDYVFIAATELADGRWEVIGEAVSKQVAKETGYKKVRVEVDSRRSFPMVAEFWDEQDELLKRVEYRQLVERGGVWQADQVTVINLRSGHQTLVQNSEVSINEEFDPRLLSQHRLSKGP